METQNGAAGCREVEEAIAEVVAGTAPSALYDHIAECDACRDRRFDAERAGDLVKGAGADFREPEGFAAKLVAGVLDARKDGPETPPVTSGRTLVEASAASAPIATVSATRPDTSVEPTGGDLATNPTVLSTREAEPRPAVSETKPSTDSEKVSPAATAEAPIRTADVARSKPVVERKVTPRGRRWPVALVGGGALLAAAAAAALVLSSVGAPGSIVSSSTSSEAWSGKVATVSRAGADKQGGLSLCDEKGACSDAAEGAAVAAGSTLKTDARTRARVTLADGSVLNLDRGSEVTLVGAEKRTARIGAGFVIAQIARADDGPVARLLLPTGEAESPEGRLALTATAERATVEVARGQARLRGENGEIDARAGEEATLTKSAAPTVYASSLSEAASFDESEGGEGEPLLRGLGELRARKPGQTNEKDRAVRLAKHAVKVRVSDVVARTEVDETFTNDTDEELEGIFRFPLPPGAQIERLALEVDGKLIEGAFVDRDRGAAIWRGVIQNAAPKAPKPREEIIWVPGPWRDPALLEWQRGGRFELKIFPIPKRGSRRVVISYTQVVDQAGGVRRFTYPLAHDERGTTTVGAFDLDVEVRGNDPAWGVRARGYELTRAGGSGDAERLALHADSFVPAGDLTLEYALPDRDRAVTAWAYRMADVGPAREPLPSTTTGASGAPKAVEAEAILRDPSPYVAIALRPKLPRWQEQRERLHVLVVDTSRSMFGERYARATHLASTIVREMDRRDHFVLLACDTSCKPMSLTGGEERDRGSSTRGFDPKSPGPEAAADVERFLGGLEPDGASDLGAAVASARSAAGRLDNRELRVIYLGDGTPSIGATRPATLEAAVRSALPGRDGAVIAVGLGADCDTTSLSAMARGGGGVVVPYVPGQSLTAAALDVLGAAYGVMLRDPRVELPRGLEAVTPAQLEPIRAGAEMLLLARMTGGDSVDGTVRLTGRVADESFEQSYPLRVVATTSAGNAFIPRLYAASKIAELEASPDADRRGDIIELSQRFAVASRFTSLLVLESEAMFDAFGLVRNSVAPSFTGEVTASSESFDAEGAPEEEASNAYGADDLAESEKKSAKGKADTGAFSPSDPFGNTFGDGMGRSGGSTRRPASEGFASPPAPAATATMAPPPAKTPAASKPVAGPSADRAAEPDWWAPPPRRLVPMRRVFDRKASFEASNTLASESAGKLSAVEDALRLAPDSRDRTVALYALYATMGRLGEAQDLTARWSGRDALDPEAVLARGDLAARQGERDRALRVLGGLADVRPGDKDILRRLVNLHDSAGNTALACEHRIALAEVSRTDAALVSDGLRCAERMGQADLAAAMRRGLDDKTRPAVERLLLNPPADPSKALGGDVRVVAEWQGSEDIDVALIDATGKRISWMGAPSKIVATARDVTSLRTETLSVAGLPSGRYVLEISRADTQVRGTLRGELTLSLAGETRRVPFTLDGSRAEVGTIRVFFTSRLVPM